MTARPIGPDLHRSNAPGSGPTDPVDELDPLGSLDPLGLRVDAPLFEAYLRHRADPPIPFTIPGHKQRLDLLGPIVAGDLPLHGGVDTVRLSGGLLLEAERRAAAHWGADRCRFSTGGSTHGNQALALTVGRPGDSVIVSRSLHRSLLLGLVLAGLEPVWVAPTIDTATGLPGGVAPDAVVASLEPHPSAVAVFVGDPSYAGMVGDIAALAEVAHAHGIPLLVDAAWGAHLGAHPALPGHPLALGADAMVTSTHKTLPALSPGAVIAMRADRLDPDRFDRAVDATHTTSPSGAVLASIDAARALMARDGEHRLGALIDLVADARDRLTALPGVRAVSGPHVDPTKLVLQFEAPIGLRLDDRLVARGLPIEMSDEHTLIPMVTIADDRASVDELIGTMIDAVTELGGASEPTHTPASGRRSSVWTIDPDTVLTPRDAFFSAHETVPAEGAIGRVSAELIAPYPPGVPVLAPGERITSAALVLLRTARAAGTRIAYAADPTLATLQVIAEVGTPPTPTTRGSR